MHCVQPAAAIVPVLSKRNQINSRNRRKNLIRMNKETHLGQGLAGSQNAEHPVNTPPQEMPEIEALVDSLLSVLNRGRGDRKAGGV